MIVSFRLAKSRKDLLQTSREAEEQSGDFVDAASRLRDSIAELERSLMRYDNALQSTGASAKAAAKRHGDLARSVAG